MTSPEIRVQNTRVLLLYFTCILPQSSVLSSHVQSKICIRIGLMATETTTHLQPTMFRLFVALEGIFVVGNKITLVTFKVALFLFAPMLQPFVPPKHVCRGSFNTTYITVKLLIAMHRLEMVLQIFLVCIRFAAERTTKSLVLNCLAFDVLACDVIL